MAEDENPEQTDMSNEVKETPEPRETHHEKRDEHKHGKKHKKAKHAHHAARTEAREEAEPSTGFSTGFLKGVAIALAILLIISVGVNGYLIAKKSGAPTTTMPSAVTTQTQTPPAQQQQPPAVPTVTKSDKPKVELFIMSYCPYGLQMQKAYVQAVELLGAKADMQVKWVAYAMHGEKELQENTRQYCIQKEQPATYNKYMRCFVASTDTTKCQAEAGVNTAKLETCYAAADKEFSITANFNDQASWLSGEFPQYNVNKAECTTYGVQGSPTMVINGKQASVARSAEAVKQAICAAFNTPPAECQQTLNTNQEQPGPGAINAGTTAGTADAANCG